MEKFDARLNESSLHDLILQAWKHDEVVRTNNQTVTLTKRELQSLQQWVQNVNEQRDKLKLQRKKEERILAEGLKRGEMR